MSRWTIAASATLEGIGLHLGEPCRLTFKPAVSRSGISFRRTDIAGAPAIPATVDHVSASERRTQLGSGHNTVHTVEHALAAVAALEIDDLMIEMDGPEPPILDGSAGPFFDALKNAWLAALEAAGDSDTDGAGAYYRRESVYEAFPSDSLDLDITIEFPHLKIGRQSKRVEVTAATFATELAQARTFGFVHEVEWLRSRGLIKGASTENAVVLDETEVVSGPLRWPDEFVRHISDGVGCLALAGAR